MSDPDAAFHDVIFPARLAHGVTGGPQRRVDIVSLASGHEQRNASTARARRRWILPGATRPIAEARQLLTFFEARGGQLHAFRFSDPLEPDTGLGHAATPGDVTLGVGNGAQTRFVLRAPSGHPIHRPRLDSLLVSLDGAPALNVGHDPRTAELVFATAPASGTVITAGCAFDITVRFDQPQLQLTHEAHGAVSHEELHLIEVLA